MFKFFSKVAATLLLVLGVCTAQAQEFKPFKVNLSLGYAKPTGAGASGGILLALEPKYGLNDQIDVGLRLESALMARAISYDGQNGDVEVKGLSSYLLTGNYHFTTNNVRPFIGAGVGLFGSAATTVMVNDGTTQEDVSVAAQTKFGGMLRAGVKIGHFVAAAEYNLVPKTNTATLTGGTIESRSSYLGIKLGFDIGGGRQ